MKAETVPKLVEVLEANWMIPVSRIGLPKRVVGRGLEIGRIGNLVLVWLPSPRKADLREDLVLNPTSLTEVTADLVRPVKEKAPKAPRVRRKKEKG